MKTLKLTDEQYAFIQHLREEIAEDVVGKYGFVREQDAVQFLIDNLADDVDIEGEFDSSAADDVAASVGAAIGGEPASNEFEEVSYVESDEPTAESGDGPADSAVEDGIDSDSGGVGDGDDGSGDDGDDSTDHDDADETATDDDSGGSADTEESADDDDGISGDSDGAADDDDMLDEMMSLLETHDDKWEESSAADFRYTVELPDGSTENVQTKDDVRALLFKNYR